MKWHDSHASTVRLSNVRAKVKIQLNRLNVTDLYKNLSLKHFKTENLIAIYLGGLRKDRVKDYAFVRF